MFRARFGRQPILLECRAAPAVFTVTTDGDSGAGSLRQAIADANAQPGADVVQFDPAQFQPSVPRFINLTSGQLTVSDALTVVGPGNQVVTLDANFASRALVATADLTISSIAIIRAANPAAPSPGNGGAVYSTAAFSATDTIFESNSASSGGAIHHSGPTLTLNDCIFNGNSGKLGGAVYSTGTMSMQYCQLMNNRGSVSGARGGGVYLASGSLTIEASSFYGCGSSNTNFGEGGAVYCGGAFVAKNTSFSSNSAAVGAGVHLAAGGTLWNCTVAHNVAGGTGGGIRGDVTLESTIVSNNTAMTGPDIFGAVTAKNCALGSSAGFSSFTNQGGNLPFGQDFKVQPGSFGHGGLVPVTTILANSPCKDAGSNPGGELYDPRGPGFPRMVGVAPDIGAFEVQPPPRIAALQVNDGSSQRSRVVQVAFTVDTPDYFGGTDPLFQFTRLDTGAAVTCSFGGPYTVPPNTFSFRFTAGPIDGTSLADGVYVLRVFTNGIKDGAGQTLDGNGDGIGGDDYVSPLTGPGRIHRLFGDADGDGDVDAADFAALRGAFGGGLSVAFDFDGDVDAADFGQFRARFGTAI